MKDGSVKGAPFASRALVVRSSQAIVQMEHTKALQRVEKGK